MRKYNKLAIHIFGIIFYEVIIKMCIPTDLFAQCFPADFIVSDTVCIGESIQVDYSPFADEQYDWDFCEQDFNSPVQYRNVLNEEAFKSSFGYTLVQGDSLRYGFLPKSDPSTLYRLDYGRSLTNVPVMVDLGSFGEIFGRIHSISFLKEGDNWFALLTDLDASKLYRLSFGSSLENLPTIQTLSLSLLNAPTDVKLEQTPNGIFALIANGNDGVGSIVQLDFGSSILNEPQERRFTISGTDRIRGLSLLQDQCNAFIGLVSSYDNNRLYLLDFQSDLFITPAISQLPLLGTTIRNPARNFLAYQQDSIYAFVQSRFGDLYKLTLDKNYTVNSNINLGKIDNSSSNAFGFSMAKEGSTWNGFSVDFSQGKLNRVQFNEDCSFVNTTYSTERNPKNVSYSSGGDYAISLKIRNNQGLVKDTIKAIHVKNSFAPDVNISLDGICFGSSSELTLTSDQPLTSAAWYINGDTLAEEVINYNFPTPGTYPVTLEVESADGCGQRVTQDITIYEPPAPKFTVDQTVICSNGAVQFQNLTDTKGADEIITYAWDFNGEGSSNEANPSFTFTTGGSKTVSLTASIPGCDNSYDTTFVVEQGPVVDFNFPPQICQGDAIVFENLSSGDNITGFQWSFGEGGSYSSSSLDNPVYAYDTAGTFIASLQVNNAVGCETTLSKTLTVYAQPEASFMADIACAGAPTQFSDESTTGINSNVIAWAWDFGDGGTASTRNPQYVYGSPGLYAVRLSVTTSAGCRDTFVQEVLVESPVTAAFNAQSLCPTDAESVQTAPYTVQFNDASAVSGEELISEWLWTINGENFVISDPRYTFAAPGTYQVSLTVFSESACNASVTQNITIEAQPQPDFSYTLNCAGQPVTFSNQTLSENVAISGYQWTFSQQGTTVATAFEENPSVAFETAGLYTATLEVETSGGCTYSSSQDLLVPAAPQAAFTADRTYGGAPLTVNFTNQSSQADTYVWDFGGAGSSTEASPGFTFDTPGTYTVRLTTETALGCSDTFTETIEVVEPVTDASLQSISLLSGDDDDRVRMLLIIRNNGTLPVQDFPISVTVDQLLSIEERFEGVLEPGQQISYPLDFSISTQLNQRNQLRYVCATLGVPDDVSLSNNRGCTSLEERLSVIAPYPNPASDAFEVSLVLPQADAVQVELISEDGKQMQDLRFSDTRQGLNTFSLDVTGMAAGSYLLRISYLESAQTYRLMVGP